MQVGTITVDGIVVGSISVSLGAEPDSQSQRGTIGQGAPEGRGFHLSSYEEPTSLGDYLRGGKDILSPIDTDKPRRKPVGITATDDHPRHFDTKDVREAIEGEQKSTPPIGKEVLEAETGGKSVGWWTSERQKQAVDYLKEHAGLPEMGARGLVARWAGVESTDKGPWDLNASGHSGIAQWDRGRFKGTQLGDFEGQLALASRELTNGSEGRAARMLRDAKTPLEAAVAAAQFERAEGYNARTGADAWVGKTVRHMQGVPGGQEKPQHFDLHDIHNATHGPAMSYEDAKEGGPAVMPGAMLAATGQPPEAFIFHHTGGGGTIEGLKNTLRERGLGVEYAMDREGNIYRIGGPGAANIMTGWGKGAGLSNKNIVGMEVIARDNRDVTPAQVRSAQEFMRKNYPNTPVFGHGEVNPGHKEADEGMAIVGAIRRERAQPAPQATSPIGHEKPIGPQSSLTGRTKVADLSTNDYTGGDPEFEGAPGDAIRHKMKEQQRMRPGWKHIEPGEPITPGEKSPDPRYAPFLPQVRDIKKI